MGSGSEDQVATRKHPAQGKEFNVATIPSRHDTKISVLYTDEALYFGAYCADAHPESLVVTGHERDHQEEYLQDLVEFFFDSDFDQENVAKVTINSTGAVTDVLTPDLKLRNPEWDYSWNLESESAGHVGDDYWSIEYRVEFGHQPQVPIPEKGALSLCPDLS